MSAPPRSANPLPPALMLFLLTTSWPAAARSAVPNHALPAPAQPALSWQETPVPSAIAPEPIAAEQVLYAADWSVGMDGWTSDPGGWHVSNGLLIYNDTEPDIIMSPYQVLGTSDYAVETEIQITNLRTNAVDPHFSLAIRREQSLQRMVSSRVSVSHKEGEGQELRLSSSILGEGGYDSFPLTDAVRIDLGDQWHTYRVELHLNSITVAIDGKVVASAVDDKTPWGGGGHVITLAAGGLPIRVRSLRVLALAEQPSSAPATPQPAAQPSPAPVQPVPSAPGISSRGEALMPAVGAAPPSGRSEALMPAVGAEPARPGVGGREPTWPSPGDEASATAVPAAEAAPQPGPGPRTVPLLPTPSVPTGQIVELPAVGVSLAVPVGWDLVRLGETSMEGTKGRMSFRLMAEPRDPTEQLDHFTNRVLADVRSGYSDVSMVDRAQYLLADETGQGTPAIVLALRYSNSSGALPGLREGQEFCRGRVEEGRPGCYPGGRRIVELGRYSLLLVTETPSGYFVVLQATTVDGSAALDRPELEGVVHGLRLGAGE